MALCLSVWLLLPVVLLYLCHRASGLVGIHKGVTVYVYTVEDAREVATLTSCPGKQDQHASGQWGFEVKLHEWLLKSVLRTLNPQEADFFFIPSYAKCLDDFRLKDTNELNATFTSLVASLPYFRRSNGNDHIVVFPSGRGPTLFLDWRKRMPNSIFIVPEPHFSDNQAALAPYFHPHRDILVPGHIRAAKLDTLLSKRRPLAERAKLMAYKGSVQGKVWRVQVGDLGKRYPDEIALEGDYEGIMGNARFCLIPRGQSAWTRRTYEAFYAECVPVFLSDHVELPFESSVDYSKMTIKWPGDKIDDSLVAYLRSVPLASLQKAQAYLQQVRCLFDYSRKAHECSPYGGIAAALGQKLQVSQDAQTFFWNMSGTQ